MTARRERFAWIFAVCVIGAILALTILGIFDRDEQSELIDDRGDLYVMNTEYCFQVIVPAGSSDIASRAFDAARISANRVGVLMNTHFEDTQLAHFNTADAGEIIELDEQILEVLRASKQIYHDTNHAFDVTIEPLIQLWRNAKTEGVLPDRLTLTQARDASCWDDIKLHGKSAEKTRSTASVNLGGIAKGYAIDKAIVAMQKLGITNASVEIGGDLRCVGPGVDGEGWAVSVLSPFDDDVMIARLKIRDAAVCTSGNYRREKTIAGKKVSHILDPRDPMRSFSENYPASVTVIAPDAMTADAWATALSVLGPGALTLLEDESNDHIEAMIIMGTADDYQIFSTEGYEKLLIKSSNKKTR